MTRQQENDLRKLEAMNAPDYRVKYLAVTDRDLRRMHEVLSLIGSKQVWGRGTNRPDKDLWAISTAERIKTLFSDGDHANSKN